MIQAGPRALGCQATCQANILGGRELWQEATEGKWASALGKSSLQRHKVSAERPAFHWHVLQPYHQGTINLSGALAENFLFLQGFCGTSSWICHFYSASTLCLIICLPPATPCPEQLHTAQMLHTQLWPVCQSRCHCEKPTSVGTSPATYKCLTFSSTSLETIELGNAYNSSHWSSKTVASSEVNDSKLRAKQQLDGHTQARLWMSFSELETG